MEAFPVWKSFRPAARIWKMCTRPMLRWQRPASLQKLRARSSPRSAKSCLRNLSSRQSCSEASISHWPSTNETQNFRSSTAPASMRTPSRNWLPPEIVVTSAPRRVEVRSTPKYLRDRTRSSFSLQDSRHSRQTVSGQERSLASLSAVPVIRDAPPSTSIVGYRDPELSGQLEFMPHYWCPICSWAPQDGYRDFKNTGGSRRPCPPHRNSEQPRRV